MNRVMDLAREHWSGSYKSMGSHSQAPGGYYDYSDAIPLLFTTLERLQTHGPHADVWWRCGHGQWEALPDALANPQDIDAWHQRDEHRRRRDEQEGQQTAATAVWGQPPAAVSTPAPVPPQIPCARCGQPVSASDVPLAPAEDGRHCPACRVDLAQPPGLIKAFLQRRP
ncbi:hypothetical protein ABZU45_36800 [Streptomyces avermitilis]|uniref:hypothetical protein n=1 Tax=Streptomyces avermitilis TaxID=33903 RepID=UPI0033A7A692